MTASPLRQALLDIEEEHSFEIQRLFDRVRTGAHVWNAQFDRILPLCWRRFSIMHWTPVQVARRAAQFLVSGPETQVLDVGSGPGKFCLVGALATQGILPVWNRDHIWWNSLGALPISTPFPGCAFCVPMPETWTGADYNAFYFYNPFYENLDPDKKLDERVELSPSLYDRTSR